MKGRKPKSLAVHLLAGNAGSKTLADSPDPFVCEALNEPEGLDPLASQEWKRLTSALAPVLSRASEGMLLVACTSYSDMVAARKVLAECGTTYEVVTKSGDTMIRPRPEVAILQNARNQYHKALCELGAAPVAGTRIRRLPEKKTAKEKSLGTAQFFT